MKDLKKTQFFFKRWSYRKEQLDPIEDVYIFNLHRCYDWSIVLEIGNLKWMHHHFNKGWRPNLASHPQMRSAVERNQKPLTKNFSAGMSANRFEPTSVWIFKFKALWKYNMCKNKQSQHE